MRLKPRNGVLIAVGVWCLMVVVLANAYAGKLLSFLSVAKLEPVINSLDELAKSDTCQLIVQGGEDLVNDFLVKIKLYYTVEWNNWNNILQSTRFIYFRMQKMGRWNQLATHWENTRKMSSTNSTGIQSRPKWWTVLTLSFTSVFKNIKTIVYFWTINVIKHSCLIMKTGEFCQLRSDRFDLPRKWEKVSNYFGKRNCRFPHFCLHSVS